MTRRNQPTAYRPVPGPPVNLRRTTMDRVNQLNDEVRWIGRQRESVSCQIDTLQSEASELFRRQSILILERDTLLTQPQESQP